MTFVRDFSISNEDPSIPDHFPGNPVVPGVVILERVRECLVEWKPQARIRNVVTAKFISPILPEQRFRIHLTEKGLDVSFQCIVDGEVIAQGKLKLDDQS